MDKHEGMQRDELKQNDPHSQPIESVRDGLEKATETEAPITARDWWVSNGPVLAIVFALLVYLFMKFDNEGLIAIAKAAIGLSFVVVQRTTSCRAQRSRAPSSLSVGRAL